MKKSEIEAVREIVNKVITSIPKNASAEIAAMLLIVGDWV